MKGNAKKTSEFLVAATREGIATLSQREASKPSGAASHVFGRRKNDCATSANGAGIKAGTSRRGVGGSSFYRGPF